MTMLQIRVILLTAELGSISAAAKQLNVSQPNASNCIRLLEEEVGFPIFYRTSAGAALTRKGALLLDHARQILAENDRIMALHGAEEVYQLRVGCTYYTPVVDAFLTLCSEHREDPEADFRYYSISVEEGIAELPRRNLDIMIAPVMKHQIAGLVSECKRNNIAMTSLCMIPAVINVRKDHPAALDGRCSNITQGSALLKEYPYVTNRSLFEDNSSTGYNDSDFIQCSYKIFVDEVDVKMRLVGSTNAFSFGIRTTSSMMERYGLAAFPVPGITLEAFALTRPADTKRRELQEFLELLNRNLEAVKV